jgi:Transglutaminase-like superfamily
MDIRTLAAAAFGVVIYAIASACRADIAPVQPADENTLDAAILINGQAAGTYRERTVHGADQVEDTVDQQISINRLGSSVEILSKEVSLQDTQGHLISGHFETTSSKSTVATDLVVQAQAIVLRIHSGDRTYSRTLPLAGDLLGPQGIRLLLSDAGSCEQSLHYRTFTSALNDVMDVALKCLSREALTIEGVSVQTRKWEMRAGGIPTPWTLWVDHEGRTVRMLQDSPFGPIETERRQGRPPAQIVAATLPEESYESTLAVSNIRLPHPRELSSVTVELSKKLSDGINWPDFASETQKIVSKTPERVVLQISQTRFPSASKTLPSASGEYLRPNALLQSDDPEVERTARGVAEGELDPWKVAMALQKWTFENMHFDTGIAIAPASEVVRDRHGTCMGYSILLASLARAANIPSRLKLGYVYDGGIWGGHAWVEVFIRGKWVAIDAAEYSPGIADAARIGVITATGESGSVEGVGELGSLYSKVNIRTLNYRRSRDTVAVGSRQKDYVVRGDEYDNPWLKVRVRKPSRAYFEDLDAHWPNRAVLTIKDNGSAASLLYGRAVPSGSSSLKATLAETFTPDERPTYVRWAATPALRVRSGDKEEILAISGDAYWAIQTSGPDSHAMLDRLLLSTSIADLNSAPIRNAQ